MDHTWALESVENPDGNLLDVFMLQLHVVTAVLWTLLAVLVIVVAIPALRRIPSAFGLHVLQTKRRELALGLWASYAAVLLTGTFLLFQNAIYDPPVSGSDWSELEGRSYGVPYYYSLYAKIGLFLLMGVATAVLARQAVRAAAQSEAEGGPVDLDLDLEDDEWVHEPDSDFEDLDSELTDSGAGSGAVGLRARRRVTDTGIPDAGLWGAAVAVLIGLGGIGLCVTLIKYFHELSKAAVVYEQLRGRG